MAIIEKKCWPGEFKKINNGEKNVEFRLADFPLNAGDTLVLKEFDQKTKKYSGKKIEKRCVRVERINLLDYYTTAEIKKNGCYLIELE